MSELPPLGWCQAGYLVEELDPWPGQSDLRAGDVIVAIGEERLNGAGGARNRSSRLSTEVEGPYRLSQLLSHRYSSRVL